MVFARYDSTVSLRRAYSQSRSFVARATNLLCAVSSAEEGRSCGRNERGETLAVGREWRCLTGCPHRPKSCRIGERGSGTAEGILYQQAVQEYRFTMPTRNEASDPTWSPGTWGGTACELSSPILGIWRLMEQRRRRQRGGGIKVRGKGGGKKKWQKRAAARNKIESVGGTLSVNHHFSSHSPSRPISAGGMAVYGTICKPKTLPCGLTRPPTPDP